MASFHFIAIDLESHRAMKPMRKAIKPHRIPARFAIWWSVS
jgi:hypothetical protein